MIAHESSTIDAETMTAYQILERITYDPAAERSALSRGLLATPATISPKYFYDALGAALFGAICELPEYYPTRTERGIFERHRNAIAAAAGSGGQFVDLGAGDCAKALAWLPVLAPKRYVAVDIARDGLATALAAMAPEFPEMEVVGVVADFMERFELEDVLSDLPATFFYPGSSIGNFAPADAETFLRAIHRHCAGRSESGLLIGVDTKKDPARLVSAYDDTLGVTAAFNRNIVNQVNRILGTAIDPAALVHRALYNAGAGRIEMHLEATRDIEVRVGAARRTLTAGERILTEYSYKYAPDEFAALLGRAGFRDQRLWQDDAGDFAVFYAR
jgi:dimethylhistidine N-methyltransferase